MSYGKIPRYYPIFLNLRNKKVLVFGGGKVAERKIRSLIKSGANNITVISPTITKMIRKEVEKGIIKYIPRNYTKKDLKNAFLIIAATNNRNVNEKISQEAKCLVNVVDTPELCNFIVPSTINRGFLNIAISTCGISPALSKTIRKDMEKQFGKEFKDFTKFLTSIRQQAKMKILDKEKRQKFLKNIASKKILSLLKEGNLKEAKQSILRDFKNLLKYSKDVNKKDY